MSLFATGAGSQRLARNSQLLFYWHARRGSLVAYTGQVGRFLVVASGVNHFINGRNGGAGVVAGNGQPRFQQIVSEGTVTRLSLRGDDAPSDVERVEWDWPLKVMALTVYIKCYPVYTPGQNLPDDRRLLGLGDGTTSGGELIIERNTTEWRALRKRSAATITSQVAEAGGSVFPMEVLVTLAAGGVLTINSRTAAGVVLTDATPATDANMLIATELWATSKLYLGGAAGGNFRSETIKIARGIKTFPQMDLLA